MRTEVHWGMYGFVKIMVPFWISATIRHQISRVPKIGTIVLTTTQIAAAYLWKLTCEHVRG